MSTLCGVYILTNKNNFVLYTGVSSNLESRMYSHWNGFYPNSFVSRYRLHTLVYFEESISISDAITREKQIKAGARAKKVNLIESINPNWVDLAPSLFGYNDNQV